jgi:hypothetical protein
MPHKQFFLKMHEKAPWESRYVYNRDRDTLVSYYNRWTAPKTHMVLHISFFLIKGDEDKLGFLAVVFLTSSENLKTASSERQ